MADACRKLGLKALSGCGLPGDKSPRSDAVAVNRLALSLLKCDAVDDADRARPLKKMVCAMRDHLPSGLDVNLPKVGEVNLRMDLEQKLQERLNKRLHTSFSHVESVPSVV